MAAKKAATKKTTAKKPAAKKAPAKKTAAKKAPAKKTAAKKAPAKKAPAKKTAAKKAPAKKAAAKKAAPARKGAKRATSAKAAPKKASAPRKAAPKKKSIAQKIADVAVSVVEKVTGGGGAETTPGAEATPSGETPSGEGGASEPAPSGATESLAASPPAVAEAAPAPVPAPTPEKSPGPQVGDEAPDFTLSADDGTTVSLHDLRGKKVVLYFYPRDNTPGCTLEARDFSQLLPEFEAKNAIVLGVSTDDVDSHQHFKRTCELSVKLLADADKAAHSAYGTWREKNMYGKTVWGTARTTYLIDEDGRIARVWPKVKVEDHALDVLNAL